MKLRFYITIILCMYVLVGHIEAMADICPGEGVTIQVTSVTGPHTASHTIVADGVVANGCTTSYENLRQVFDDPTYYYVYWQLWWYDGTSSTWKQGVSGGYGTFDNPGVDPVPTSPPPPPADCEIFTDGRTPGEVVTQNDVKCTQPECNIGYGEVLEEGSCVSDCEPNQTHDALTGTCKTQSAPPEGFEPITLLPAPDRQEPEAPEETPDPDPATPEDKKSNDYLRAIKDDQGKQINAANDQTKMLENIAKNQEKTNSNDDIRASAIIDNMAIMDGNQANRDNVRDGLLRKIADKLDEDEQTEPPPDPGLYPDEITFDESADPDGDYDFTQYGDEVALGQASSDALTNELETTLEGATFPIPAAVTASGVDACLNGDVTINGHTKNLSICFNKPWMETGYYYMKVILVGLGYLQTIILLNKALLA